ncbi:N-acetyltransferase family protein [Roseococcus sp. SYP-B2431]|uniref:GNAT family N-acetyltransferase n=1 Tax=Roseococcus sp. SYP-B2431 TaxID=2496640 RepID=UPI00103D5417|nr:GNAT family N-acetyltransferase [Roseococcus sp. SYP-B2431]TCH99530.1 N-acetyltransferase family protein [Roseococcus sp. SYP-B2431]
MDADAGRRAVEAVTVRHVTDADMEAVAAIYGHYVLHGTATFETDPPSPAEMTRRRDALAAQGYPYLVAEREGVVLGYAYVSAYRPRPAYWNTVENSIYLRHDAGGMGVGKQLLRTLVETCEDLGYRQIIAMIGDSANIASLRLHLSLGFEKLGTLRSVGYKHGRWIDTICLQRSIGLGDSAPPDTAPPQA